MAKVLRTQAPVIGKRGEKLAKVFSEAGIKVTAEAAVALRERLGEAFEDIGWKSGYRETTTGFDPLPVELAERAYLKAIEFGQAAGKNFRRLGKIQVELGKLDEALESHLKSCEVQEKESENWNGLGMVYTLQDELEKALASFQKTVDLAPEKGMYRNSVVRILMRLGREAEAAEHDAQARPLVAKESEYNRACFAAICGDPEEALRLLRIALQKKQVSRQWAQRDPDFDSLRTDPRFRELVGEQ